MSLIGFALQDVYAAGAALALFAIIVLLWNEFIERRPMEKRIQALTERRKTLKAAITGGERKKDKRKQQIGLMDKIVRGLKLNKGERVESAAKRLAQAGWRSKDAVTIYLFARTGLPIVFATLAATLVFTLYGAKLADSHKWLIIAAAAAAGFYLPGVYVKNQTLKRMDIIRKAMPDALDLMVICAEAGLSMDATFERVSREMGDRCPELADEIGLTSVELSFLPDRKRALTGFAERVPLPSVSGLISTLVQTEKYGTPLAQSLRILSAEFRDERMMRAEEKAARLPAVMTVPMIIFILPPLFIVLLGPAIITTLDTLARM
jgi:tight adherence protein C